MKMRLKTGLSVGLLAFLLALTPGVAFAVGDDTDNTIQATTTQAEVESDKPDPAEIKTRVQKRKADLKTRLDAAKQARLKSRCKASQGSLSSISGRIKGLETSRTHVYENLTNRLTKLSEHLQTKGIDTAELDTEVTELGSMVEVFNTDLAAYKVVVSDLADMDCATDPIGFQASLDAARTSRTKTADDAKAIRTYLSDTIKPTLSQIKAGVEKTDDTE